MRLDKCLLTAIYSKIVVSDLRTRGSKKPMARAKKASKKPPVDTLTGALADRIKGLGLTSYAVSKRSGVDVGTVSRFVNGQRTLTLRTAEKLCEALDMVLIPRPGSTLPLDIVREREERN